MNYVLDDKIAIEEILHQAPPNVEYDEAKDAYYNAKRDVSQALADLWNLPPLPEKKKQVGVDAEKWTEVRNMCDEFDKSATEALNTIRKQQQQQQTPVVMNVDEK